MKPEKDYMDRLDEIVEELEDYIEEDAIDAAISNRTAFDILYIIRDHRNALAQLYYEQNERRATR